MHRALLVFKPETPTPKLEEGTLLRFLGSDYSYDSKTNTYVFEVMGVPPTQDKIPEIQFT